jgi:hypothetical protein
MKLRLRPHFGSTLSQGRSGMIHVVRLDGDCRRTPSLRLAAGPRDFSESCAVFDKAGQRRVYLKRGGFESNAFIDKTFSDIRKRARAAGLMTSAYVHAKRLLQFHAQGKYHSDNPGDLGDIQATAAGHAVRSQGRGMVHVDALVMRVPVHLIEHGHTIGTFAVCSDHRNGSAPREPGGRQ